VLEAFYNAVFSHFRKSTEIYAGTLPGLLTCSCTVLDEPTELSYTVEGIAGVTVSVSGLFDGASVSETWHFPVPGHTLGIQRFSFVETVATTPANVGRLEIEGISMSGGPVEWLKTLPAFHGHFTLYSRTVDLLPFGEAQRPNATGMKVDGEAIQEEDLLNVEGVTYTVISARSIKGLDRKEYFEFGLRKL